MGNIPLPLIWSWDPQVLIGLALAAVLFVVGVRYSRRAGLTRAISSWRVSAYFLGLLSIYVALQSPLDAWANMYLTAHMIQHILLIYVAAPLLVLSAPLMLVWRAVPISARRDTLRWGLRHPRLRHTLSAIGTFFTQPNVVWVLFVGDFLAWHLPTLYNLALENQTIHDAEHMLFLGTALLYWAQIINCAPLHPRMGYGERALYLFTSSMTMGIVSLALVYVPTPIYAYYAMHAVPGGPGAVIDQAAAGAIMNVAVAPIFGVAFCILAWKWLESDEERAASLPAGRRLRLGAEPIQPMFKGKPLRWTPIVLQGGGTSSPVPEATVSGASAHPEFPLAADS